MDLLNFDTPELSNEFKCILNTLDKIKCVEQKSLSCGDFEEKKFKMSKVKESRREDKAGRRTFYWIIIEMFGVIIGWILRRGAGIFNSLCKGLFLIISENFLRIYKQIKEITRSSYNLKELLWNFKDILTLKNLALVASIILLTPIYIAVKILFIFTKFLSSELPFE